jgi:hypothetical protein
MPNENIEIVNLSKNRIAITFSKNAIAGLREGKSFVVNVKVGRKDVKFLFMRTSSFKERMVEFQKGGGLGSEPNIFVRGFRKAKDWFSRNKIRPVGKYKEVKSGK